MRTAKKSLKVRWDHMSRQELRRLQAEQLRRYLVTRVVPYSSFFRERFKREHLNPEHLKCLEDLQHIPMISKHDLLPTEDSPQRARDFVLIPDKARLRREPSVLANGILRGRVATQKALEREFRPVFLTSTTGRSTEPVPFLYTQHDIDNLSSAGNRLVEVLGASTDFRVVNMFPYAPHLAFWQTHYACLEFGAFNVSTGGGKVMGTEGNIRLIDRIKPNAIIGMPTFIYHVLSLALEQGCRFESLRTIALGGEKVPAGMRRKLLQLATKLGAQDPYVVATYGFTEAKMAWGECPSPYGRTPGGYHIYPDLGVVEIVDPVTGELRKDGEPGEIVFTPLDSRGSVVVRYRTGDVIDGGLVHEPCPYCGRRTPRLVGKISRKSEFRHMQLDKLKGTLVDFNALEHLLDDMPDVGCWQIELRKVNNDPLDLDEVILHVQANDQRDAETFSGQLKRHVAAHTELSPNEVLFHSSAEMRRLQGVGSEMKEKRVIDNRPAAQNKQSRVVAPTATARSEASARTRSRTRRTIGRVRPPAPTRDTRKKEVL
ncbi:MAG: phenylacetate-CoA ligase [Candidatus Promineifilaceae bacterium]